MLILTGPTDPIHYISRYNLINKYELINHTTNVSFSGETEIYAYNDGGRIVHSGVTLEPNHLYTYQSFWLDTDNDTYYLANKTLIRTWEEDERVDRFIVINKDKHILKTKD